jgi:hypothetical protein
LEDPLLCPDCGGEMRIISFTEGSFPAAGDRESRGSAMTAKFSFLTLKDLAPTVRHDRPSPTLIPPSLLSDVELLLELK